MGQRADLHQILKQLSENTYFQPPSNLEMEYPCIVYERDSADTKFAGNVPYLFTQRYQVTVIDRNPDGDIRNKVAALPMCLFNRHFTAGNLHHDVFNLYF